MEAYIWCPLDVCIRREAKTKGGAYQAPPDIHKKAVAKESTTVPSIGVPYEEPGNPEVTVDSDKMNAEECAERILKAIMRLFSDFSSLSLEA